MTKDEYLDRATRAAIRLGRYLRFYDAEFLPSELVKYDGIKYFPTKLCVSFDRKGMPRYTCVLHSLAANSTTEAELSRVEGVYDEN